jgi:hypothetical protein
MHSEKRYLIQTFENKGSDPPKKDRNTKPLPGPLHRKGGNECGRLLFPIFLDYRNKRILKCTAFLLPLLWRGSGRGLEG